MKFLLHLTYVGAAAAAYLNLQSQPSNGTVFTLRLLDVQPSAISSAPLFPTAPSLQKPIPGNLTFNASGPPLTSSGVSHRGTWTAWQHVAQIMLWMFYLHIYGAI